MSVARVVIDTLLQLLKCSVRVGRCAICHGNLHPIESISGKRVHDGCMLREKRKSHWDWDETMANRTIEQAEQIIRANGAESWIGLTDKDELGCTREEHEWLQTVDESELVGRAKSAATDEDE